MVECCSIGLKTKKARKGDESNKPLLNQVNYVLLHLHLAGKHDAKPSHDELKDWLIVVK